MQHEVHDARLISTSKLSDENLIQLFENEREHNVADLTELAESEFIVTYCARVSNPNNQQNIDTAPRLLRYLMKHKHWSPLEMSNMVVEVETTRAIAAQILRHRSFSFQEFCLAGNARITVSNGLGRIQRLPIEDLYQKWGNPSFKARYARSYDDSVGRFIEAPILSVYESGQKPVYRFQVGNRSIDCTREHRVLTQERGFVEFGEAYDDNLTVALNGATAEPLPYQGPKVLYGWTLGMTAKWGKIDSQTYLSVQMTYDIEMNHPTHNFVADGIVVHNSQRYSSVDLLGTIGLPHLRSQDLKNKQASHDDLDPEFVNLAEKQIQQLYNNTFDYYEYMLSKGVAKECARSVLPLGTPTRLYMNGTLRSWLHYLQARCSIETQHEHRLVACGIKSIFDKQFPTISEAAFS